MLIQVDQEGAAAIVELIDQAMRNGARALPAIDKVRNAIVGIKIRETENGIDGKTQSDASPG